MLDDLKISGWIKSSFIDYPGTVATVLFLSGCTLRCPYCHNPQIVRDELEPVDFEYIREYLLKRKGIIEGVVISGGEPTLYSRLDSLCSEIRRLDLKVKIDTNGLDPEAIIRCAPDYLALDIKTSIDKYGLLKTPFADSAVRLGRSIDLVRSMGSRAEVRITVVPGIVDKSDIEEFCRELAGLHVVYLQQFSIEAQMLDAAFANVKPYAQEVLQEWCSDFLNAGINCKVRGVD